MRRVEASVVATAVGAGVVGLALARAQKQRAERRTVLADDSLHEQRVAEIARQLRERRSTAPLSLHKRTVSHQVPKAKDARVHDEKVDISRLTSILEIDPIQRTCVAEAGVTFYDLVHATLRYGLVPTVVPEHKTITVGGAVAGCSIESMSFRYGGFHDSCLEYEVVTARGEILTCTPENENKLVFEMIHGTFGTLGILTKLKFKLVPAKPFVRVVYETYSNLESYQAAIQRHFESKDVDFMDGMIHSPAEFVLSLGHFVDQAPYTNRYDWMKVYYLSTRQRQEDYLTTPDYLWRYDKGVTSHHPKSAVGRFFLRRFMGSTQTLRLAEKLRWLLDDERPTFTLDVFLPVSRMKAFTDWYAKEFQFYPVWVVPYARVRDYAWLTEEWYAGTNDKLFIDLAIYGMKQRGHTNYYKLMEDKLLELGGVKTLISHNYYSEEDFWKTWNKRNYDEVKARTDPQNIFRNLYTKTCRAVRGLPESAGTTERMARSKEA